MSATPNFGFEVPIGSDTVNLLTQNYPNWTSLDTILQAIKDAGVTTATATKVGTVHQLVRTVSSCNVLRFTATANYTAGDTFTVDGNAVTTTTPQGTSLDGGAFVINQSVLGVLNGAVLTLAVGGGSSDASGITYDNTGSGLTASNVQDAIDEVVSDIPTGFAASAISYDNSGSGLVATDVQDAIDELASGSGGAEHGVYELWANADITTAFSPQDVAITNANMANFDAFVVVMEGTTDEKYGAVWFEIDAAKANQSPFVEINMTTRYWGGSNYNDARRAVTNFTIVGNTATFTFGGGYYGTTAQNACGIPVRILGLVHNS